MVSNRLCLSVSSFHDHFVSARIDIFSFLDHAHRLGFRWVELCDLSIPSTRFEELQRVARECQSRGLRIACLDIRNDFTVADSKGVEQQILHVQRWIEAAGHLSVNLARLWMGVAAEDEDAFRRVCQAFRRVVPVAKANGVRLALENHGGLGRDADTIIRVVDFVGSPYLGTCPDFGWLQPADRIRSLKKLFPYALHAHAKTHRFDTRGLETEIDYSAIGAIVRESSYRGFFSVEYEGPGEDRETGIRQTAALVESLFLQPGEEPAARSSAPAPDAAVHLRRSAARDASKPPYVGRVATRSVWHEARSIILPYVERLASQPETAGIVVLGGLADSSHRRFVDEYSDLDLALFLSIPDARGYTSPKAFVRDHPELLPPWLPAFQFDLPVDNLRLEVNCHQLILEIEENPNLRWGFPKQEAYLYTGEILYDPSGRVARLVDAKCRGSAGSDFLITLASQLPWYGWVNPERQIRRGFPENACILLNHAMEILIEMVFLANGRLAPHLKWQFEMACDLPWLPRDFRHRVSRMLQESALPERIRAMHDLGEEVLGYLKAEGLIPENPFRYASLHLDPDRQLRPRTAADRLLDLCSDVWGTSQESELYGQANYSLLSLSQVRPGAVPNEASKGAEV